MLIMGWSYRDLCELPESYVQPTAAYVNEILEARRKAREQ